MIYFFGVILRLIYLVKQLFCLYIYHYIISVRFITYNAAINTFYHTTVSVRSRKAILLEAVKCHASRILKNQLHEPGHLDYFNK